MGNNTTLDLSINPFTHIDSSSIFAPRYKHCVKVESRRSRCSLSAITVTNDRLNIAPTPWSASVHTSFLPDVFLCLRHPSVASVVRTNRYYLPFTNNDIMTITPIIVSKIKNMHNILLRERCWYRLAVTSSSLAPSIWSLT